MSERKQDVDVQHWADQAAERVIKEKGNRKEYTIAAGITPSGTVHIGNFREIITVDLVKRAFEKKGKKVRFIYSWDDYDVFRKVPLNMPKQELLKTYLRKPIAFTPDPYDCHSSYAEHHEKEVEESIPLVDVHPHFFYQHKRYRAGEYDKEIKRALEQTEEIKSILNKFRDAEVDDKWLPITLFCEKCGNDTVIIDWKGNYTIHYTCECGNDTTFEFNKKHLLKLKWRVDWPMRWFFEQVDFEPGGKDHSTAGGSFDTGKLISQKVWNHDAPSYVMYNFINVKGKSGKMSSSSGDVVTLRDVLDIYEPEIVRYIFAGTRPSAEFAISFDADVIKLYEDFDKCERVYFAQEKVSDKEKVKQSRIYELSLIGKPAPVLPIQPGFRHLTLVLQINSLNVKKTIAYFKDQLRNEHDKRRLEQRALCAKNWIEKYAPDEFVFSVQSTVATGLHISPIQRKALHQLADRLMEKEWTPTDLHNEFYIICQNNALGTQDFFTAAYQVLINKQKGPRLASFLLEIGRKKSAELLKKV